MSHPPIPLLFLKTPTSPIDAYTTYFTSPHAHPETSSSAYTYQSVYVPVLEHTHNHAALSPLLRPSSPTLFPYGGLIFTSARAVEAFAAALACSDRPSTDLKTWILPLYVCGPATADALRINVLPFLGSCEVLGEDAGTGEALAPLIIKDYCTRSSVDLDTDTETRRKPLLFLAGEKHRDIIPRMLLAEGLQVDEMVVYSTVERTGFRSELEQRLKETEGMTQTSGTRWIVIFSPAAGEAILRALRWLDERTVKVKEIWAGEERKTFVASIGPTTKEYMRKEFEFDVDVCAERPSAEGVREGIERFMRSKEGG